MGDEQPRLNQQRPLSIWDLPETLLTQPHKFRKRTPKLGKERSHHAAILAFIYRNRFATASQVQRRFMGILKSDRTARRHLAEMQESLGYLDLVPTPSPLWPKVYSVSSRGMRNLAHAFQRGQPSWRPPVNDRRRTGFSIHHVYHELACTEFLLRVHEAAKTMGIELLELQRRSLVKNEAFRLPERSGSRLVPDGMFLLRSSQGMICTFLEIDTGSMSTGLVVEKLRRYAKWAETQRSRDFMMDTYRKHGAASPQSRFRIAIICGGDSQAQSQRRLNSLIEMVQILPMAVRSVLWLITTTAIRDAECILTRKTWRNPRDKGPSTLEMRPFLTARVTSKISANELAAPEFEVMSASNG